MNEGGRPLLQFGEGLSVEVLTLASITVKGSRAAVPSRHTVGL